MIIDHSDGWYTSTKCLPPSIPGGEVTNGWVVFGGRWMCLDDLAPHQPCLMYSLREGEELSMEVEMHRLGSVMTDD